MAKYIIDLPEETIYLNALERKNGKVVWAKSYDIEDYDLRPYVKSESYIDGLKKGQDDAWELARRIICPSDCCEDSISAHTKEIFNKEGWEIRGIFTDLSYQEAKSKYKEWQKQKDEIHVGDEVIAPDPYYESMVVTSLRESDRGDMWLSTIGNDGMVYEFMETSVKKTGRHFPEVAKLLKKIREE